MSWEIFVKFLASTSKISKPTNSVSAWSAHETNQRSCRRIPLPIFWKKILNRSPSFAAKNNFCLPSKLIYSWITGLSWLTRQIIDNSLTRFFFIKTILPNFYPGQILLAMRLKICPLRPNSTQEVGRNTFVFLPTLLSCSSRFLRALEQNRV